MALKDKITDHLESGKGFFYEDVKEAINTSMQILKDSICSVYDIETSSTINSWIDKVFEEEFGNFEDTDN